MATSDLRLDAPKRHRATAKEMLLRAMTERELQQVIVEACRRLGYWVFHDQDSRRNRAGLPDLVIIGHRRLLFAELKTERGLTSVEQDHVISELRKAGQEVVIVRPSDMDTFIAELERRAKS